MPAGPATAPSRIADSTDSTDCTTDPGSPIFNLCSRRGALVLRLVLRSELLRRVASELLRRVTSATRHTDGASATSAQSGDSSVFFYPPQITQITQIVSSLAEGPCLICVHLRNLRTLLLFIFYSPQILQISQIVSSLPAGPSLICVHLRNLWTLLFSILYSPQIAQAARRPAGRPREMSFNLCSSADIPPAAATRISWGCSRDACTPGNLFQNSTGLPPPGP